MCPQTPIPYARPLSGPDLTFNDQVVGPTPVTAGHQSAQSSWILTAELVSFFPPLVFFLNIQ